jgi:hypothetical protein
MRLIIPLLIIVVAVLSLGAIAYPTLPSYTTLTHTSLANVYVTLPEEDIAYSYYNVTCTGTSSVACYVEVAPYTTIATSTAQVIETILALSASTNYVPFAVSGLAGAISLFSLTILFVLGVVLIVLKRLRSQ